MSIFDQIAHYGSSADRDARLKVTVATIASLTGDMIDLESARRRVPRSTRILTWPISLYLHWHFQRAVRRSIKHAARLR